MRFISKIPDLILYRPNGSVARQFINGVYNGTITETQCYDAMTGKWLIQPKKTLQDLSGVTFIDKSVAVCATTANLAATYSSGVLTMSAVGVVTIDGVTPALGDVVSIEAQTTTSENGLYIVTVLGTASVAGVFTRIVRPIYAEICGLGSLNGKSNSTITNGMPAGAALDSDPATALEIGYKGLFFYSPLLTVVDPTGYTLSVPGYYTVDATSAGAVTYGGATYQIGETFKVASISTTPADNLVSASTTSTFVDKGASLCATTANLAATYSNGVLTMSAVGVVTIDGVATALTNRVLIKDQTDPSQNGIYTVTTAGTSAVAGVFTRATNMDAWSEVPGAYTLVSSGTTQANTSWECTSASGGTLGTTAINWVGSSGTTDCYIYLDTKPLVETNQFYDEAFRLKHLNVGDECGDYYLLTGEGFTPHTDPGWIR